MNCGINLRIKRYAHEYLRHVIIGNLKEKIMTEITCYMLLQLSLDKSITTMTFYNINMTN